MMEKIDFVLPWVDPTDVEWQKERNKFEVTESGDGLSPHRFRDLETLRYVLRSIEQHCPWYNKIILITNGHYPKWLNVNHPKVRLVRHEELYFKKEHLPVFNSSSIEMNLPKLDGLTEHFVYLNDDMIIAKSVKQERFFQKGLPVDFFSHGWFRRGMLYKMTRSNDSWVSSVNNNIELINRCGVQNMRREHLYHESYPLNVKLSNLIFSSLIKKFLWIQHWHHPQPYLKRTLIEAGERFYSQMLACSKNRFRSHDDLTQYLYRYLQLINGDFVPYYHGDGLVVQITSFGKLKEAIRRMSESKYKFVCFNDDSRLGYKEFLKVKRVLNHHLISLFPSKASFEVNE